MYQYPNRESAGFALAELLNQYKNHPNTLVLALPRGGVPVAYQIARALHVPLDLFIVRKLGVPGYEELAMGALAMNNVQIFNQEIVKLYNINQKQIDAVIKREQEELDRRMRAYRGDRPPLAIAGKTIILVDDGVATGATLKVAIKAIRSQKPKKLIVAVPVADPKISQEIAALVDEFYCPLQPSHLQAVGAWYTDFSQTSDEEVSELLNSKIS